jgi:enamine deaminase RidA (YjgF/YER057c/UK114 family)
LKESKFEKRNKIVMLDKYLLILPNTRGVIEEEWKQCLGKLNDGLDDGHNLVKLNVFIEADDFESFVVVRSSMMHDLELMFKEKMPACNISIHPPEGPWKVSLEAGLIKVGSSEPEYKLISGINYVTCSSNGVKLLWCGGTGATLFPDDTSKAASEAFDLMRLVLETEDMNLDNVVRQWNYIGDITSVTERGENYHNFNSVRSRNYAAYRTQQIFPAATGIGIKHGGGSLDFFAVKGGDELRTFPVNNPGQVRPYQYGQVVLKGVQCPQFERAMAVSYGNEYTLFISGTASILGQDTIGIDDIEKQTIVTIENIMRLVDTNNKNGSFGTTSFDTENLILLRVYVKRQSDFEKVKQICRSYFKGAPSIFIEADVCRENLLVEIEAEFHKMHYNS